MIRKRDKEGSAVDKKTAARLRRLRKFRLKKQRKLDNMTPEQRAKALGMGKARGLIKDDINDSENNLTERGSKVIASGQPVPYPHRLRARHGLLPYRSGSGKKVTEPIGFIKSKQGKEKPLKRAGFVQEMIEAVVAGQDPHEVIDEGFARRLYKTYTGRKKAADLVRSRQSSNFLKDKPGSLKAAMREYDKIKATPVNTTREANRRTELVRGASAEYGEKLKRVRASADKTLERAKLRNIVKDAWRTRKAGDQRRAEFARIKAGIMAGERANGIKQDRVGNRKPNRDPNHSSLDLEYMRKLARSRAGTRKQQRSAYLSDRPGNTPDNRFYMSDHPDAKKRRADIRAKYGIGEETINQVLSGTPVQDVINELKVLGK